MLKFDAPQLLRALDVAAYPARLTDEARMPQLATVPLEATDQGLIAYSTDRYQLVRTLAEYLDPAPTHGQGLPPVRLHRDGLKILLPALRAAKHGQVELKADAETVTFTIYGRQGDRQTVPLANVADSGEFPKIASLFRLHISGGKDTPSEGAFTVAPRYIKALTTTLGRYTREGETLTFSPDRQSPARPVAWIYGRWAHGLLMPINTGTVSTLEAEHDRVSRLFRAQPLMAAPEAAMEREDSALERATRPGTRGAQAPATV